MERLSTFRDFVGELEVTYKRTCLPTQKIQKSLDVIKFIRPFFDLCMDDLEEVKIIHLNTNGFVVNIHHAGKGTDKTCLIDTKNILRNALLIKTSSLIMIHNHPSGSLKPSKADIKISKNLKKACEIVGLNFLDSLIITRESFYSLADHSKL